MRHAGTIDTQDHARRFGDYLLTQGVKTRIDEEGDGWTVWVYDEDQLELAKDELEWFLGNPEDPIYNAESKANALRREQAKIDQDSKKRIIRVRDQWGTPQRGVLTTGLIIACVVVGLVTLFGKKMDPVGYALSINDYNKSGTKPQEFRSSHFSDIKSGEVWRLITPMFIHFGPMHLVFNMCALYFLGNMIEARRGPLILGVMVVLIAIFSNAVQYQFSAAQSPMFGGISGVVFGLFGFLWAKTLIDPTSGMNLQPQTIFMVMFFFILCFTGIFGPIANWAHASGLAFGAVLGIISTLSKELSWSHFVELLQVREHLARDFYAEMCHVERWSVRTLRQKINGMLFERTAISKKPKKLINAELEQLRDENKITPNLVFRDPYFLDFLGLKGAYQEKDLEEAILREIENFILELGCGFTFVSRQKRMIIDGEDFYLDLLFFHRKLKRLIAIELKLGKFKASYKEQMELYLRWLEKNEMQQDENPPLGMILCAEKTHEQIELLKLNDSGIHVAEYFTELPPKKLLEEKLHSAITHARAQIENREK